MSKTPSPHMPFITFEGIDKSGKSLQAKRLAQNLRQQEYPVVLVRDPGGPAIAEKIRDILLDRNLDNMSVFTELFLYEAARAQLVSESILPALQENNIVVSDRFTDSTLAYQGCGRKIPLSFIEKANQHACGTIVPRRTYILDIPWEESLRRRDGMPVADDRMEREREHFFARVRKGYHAIAEKDKIRVRLLDGTMSVETIEKEILKDALTIINQSLII